MIKVLKIVQKLTEDIPWNSPFINFHPIMAFWGQLVTRRDLLRFAAPAREGIGLARVGSRAAYHVLMI